MTQSYDLVFVGNVTCTTLHHVDGSTQLLRGGPAYQSALATTWSNRRVALVTRMAESDADVLEPLGDAGVTVFLVPAAEITRGHIFYPSEDIDQRRHVLQKTAGPFTLDDLPVIDARLLHLVGASTIEFPFEFIEGLETRGLPFSVDMQALIRRPDPDTGEVALRDFPQKKQLAAMAQKVKLDVVEAEILTGTGDQEEAAIQFERWGTPEVMVTRAAGALVRCAGKTYFEPFTNRNSTGRTGRGDTVFASYLARRMEFGVAESLKFAVALTSIKMESPGPFAGTLEQVLERMRE